MSVKVSSVSAPLDPTNVCAVKDKSRTSDDVADTTVRIDAADLLWVRRVHLHLPTEEERWKEDTERRERSAA